MLAPARWVLAAIVAIVSCGCACHPLRVHTDSRISMLTPLSATVTADLPPRRDAEPLVEMTVEGCGGAKIALIDVDGLLANANMVGPYSAGENPVALFREKLDAAAADPKVCGVVLRINSPGGGVTASDMMAHELARFRAKTGLPIVSYVLELGTGGGYYLALGGDAIIVHPAAVVGGVGVILNLYNLQDTMAMANVTSQAIKAGENIDMGSSLSALTPEAKELLQRMANEFHARFQQVVRTRRPALRDAKALDGRVFTAEQALAAGLVDQVGYLEDAVALAACRPNAAAPGPSIAAAGSWRLVMYHRRNDPARTPYAVTANSPPQGEWLPLSVPGLDRSRLPTFLYLWQAEPTLGKGIMH